VAIESFAGRIAVVTGAASGIGLALAERFAAEKMKLVLADVEAAALESAHASIRAQGGDAIAVRTDVMREEEVKRLAEAAFDKFGNVHILCNNAGVGGVLGGDGLWNLSQQDWDWVLGVNFFGVLYGIRHFVPRMLEQGQAGQIVNTASVAGLISGGTGAAYTVSKHAVVALSETLYKDLKARNARISASVLCPGWVNTKILESTRNRPEGLKAHEPVLSREMLARLSMVRTFLKEGFPPEEIAGRVVDAIGNDAFYIIAAQPNVQAAVDTRLEDLRLQRNPTILPPPSR
jgi:NAD(P)-dependent dehydrogenase (short-subunit alcohol dehydrogenase family)